MTADWDKVLKYLEPKEAKYCPETASLTQKVFLRTYALEALFGGAAGGGKSSALLMSALQYVDVPGYSAILFRRTYADLALPGAIMDRFQAWIAAEDDIRWNANNYTAVFPSGARISFGYLNNSQDYLRYKGAEFQFIGMDEVTEIRESDYRYMFSRLRRPANGPLSKVPLRMRAASNPAPNWVRQRFIVEGKESGRIFVPSKLTDNPGIDAASYRQTLQALDPVERRRLEEGDWWSTTLGSLFERESFVLLDQNEIPEISSAARAVRFWDLAATEPSQSNPDPDWTVRATGDKVTRARPFAAAVANGNIRVVRGPWLTEWLDEMSAFPEAAPHDDQVDSVVGAFTHLTGLGLPQRKQVAIIV
jgi:hypothetical protein